MKTALIVTGALSALVFVFPGLIIAGMFLLVLPGLVLMAMPTVFLYLLATWLIRFLIPVESDVVGYLLAGVAAAALASLAVLPLRLGAQAAFAEAIQPEIMPTAPIALSGHVVIEQRGDFRPLAFEPYCDALCLAVLDLDAVETVTLVRGGQRSTFALMNVDSADETAPESHEPYDPGRIMSFAGQVRDYRVGEAAKRALDAAWAARLSGPQRLVSIKPRRGAPDWQLIETRGPAANLREIIGPSGEAVLRHVTVRQRIPFIPPFIGFTAGSAGSGFAGRGFELGGFDEVRPSASEWSRPEEAFARALALKDYWAAHAPAPEPQSE